MNDLIETSKPETEITTVYSIPNIGDAHEGGFYGGRIRIGVAIFAIIWSPAAQGDVKGIWHPEYEDIPGATSCFDSMANTKAMAEAGSPLAQQALAANINGFADWCLPSRDVLEMGYRFLKPTDDENSCTFRDGDNPSSIPAGYPYTDTFPAQTIVDAFKAGGPEAFQPAWYASSTQYSEVTAWLQHFGDGYQYYNGKSYERRARFVRLIQVA